MGIRGGSVSWTSVGDDKWANGAAPVVEVWKSSAPLSSQNLGAAEKSMLNGANEVGDLAHFSFETEPKQVAETVHFAMRSLDNVGNSSELRFTTAEVPAAEVALGDNFDGETVDFQATGDFHKAEESGRGLVFSSRPGEEGSKPTSDLISREIDLTAKKDAYLKFDYKTDMGWGEKAGVYVSTDGESWVEKTEFRRHSSGWRAEAVDLSEYDGQKILLKFGVTALEGKRHGGMRVDDVRVLVGELKKPGQLLPTGP